MNINKKGYQNFREWRLGTINIRSGKEKDQGAKIYTIAKEINRNGLSFCCLQEVKYLNTGRKLITLDTGEKFEFHWCGKKKRREAGVGMLIKVDPEIEISDPDIQDARVMGIDLKIYGFNLRVVNAYSPTETGGSTNVKDCFYRTVNKACARKEKNQKLLVIGDFNAKTSLALKKCCFDGSNIIPDEEFNENGSRMKSFCRKNMLGIASSFFEYTPEQRYTWYSCDKITKNVNDYVLPESYIQQYITDCVVLPELDFDSDHRILITNLCTPMTRKARRKPKRDSTKRSPNLKSLNDDDIKESFREAVRNRIHCDNRKYESSNTISNRIVKTLESIGNEVLPRRTGRNTANEIWREDGEINRIIAERKTRHRDSEDYKQLTKSLKKRVNHLRNEELAREADEINDHATRREVENLYRCMKSGSNTFKEIKRMKKCDPNLLKAHFKEHFNPSTKLQDPPELTEAPVFIQQLQNMPNANLNTNPPDLEELHSTIAKLKTGKSANDIPTVYLKCSLTCEGFMNEMMKLYKTIWETHLIPTHWGHSKLVALWKGSSKGSVENPIAYRALQIGSSLCKILVVIIINRLNKWYDQQLQDQQQGFRAGRGTTDGIYRLKRIQQITHRMKTPVYALFVDLSAAFDHIDRKWLFKSIRQRFASDTNTNLVDIMESLYNFTTTSLADTPDDKFDTTSGVRQGGPESPILYNLYMDYVMRVFLNRCKQKGVSFLRLNYLIPSSASNQERAIAGNHEIDWIGYADDVILSFMDKSSLQQAVNELNVTFKRFGLNINISKTKTMILNHQHIKNEYPSTVCNIEGEDIENVKVFRYLGSQVKFDEPTTGDAEIELRIDSAEAKFYEIGIKIMNFKIALQTRVKILNSLIRSRLTFSCQCWTLTEKQKHRITVVYNSMLRKMVKGGYRRKEDSWSFVHTNDDIIRMARTESIGVYIEKQQRNFLAHIIRMENCSTTKRLLFNNNPSRMAGRDITLYSAVMKSQGVTAEVMIQNAITRKY